MVNYFGLEVGQEMCQFYRNGGIGNVSPITKISKFQIVLANGLKLKKTGECFSVVSLNPKYEYNNWHVMTDKIIEMDKAIRKQNNIARWFRSKYFTINQIQSIFDLLASEEEKCNVNL